MKRAIQAAREILRKQKGLDIESISRRLGVDVQEVLESQNLKQVYFSDLKAIVLRLGLSAPERSYLIGHGLGHHTLHRGDPHARYSGRPRVLRCGSLATRSRATKMEREADLFAAYLFVAEDRLKAVLLEGWAKDEDDPILALSLEFGVPEELMKERINYRKRQRQTLLTAPFYCPTNGVHLTCLRCRRRSWSGSRKPEFTRIGVIAGFWADVLLR